jgi:CPA1 family monovalent cation:H+ antiporter
VRSGQISEVEIFIGLLVTISLLVELAQPLHVPSPVLLVLAGLVLGFLPGLPAPVLDPDTFFFFFLPPLVYSEAFLFSTDRLKAHGVEISLLAVGLVAATAAAVAVVAHAALGLPWAAAFVLGAVVGPTDPASAGAVIRRLGVSPQVATILEGESLVNDGMALVIYKLAVAAAVDGTFSLAHAVPELFWVVLGGVGTGALVAWLWARLRRWVTQPEVEISFSLVMPFAAYFPAERLGASGVLAAVTTGLLVGRQAAAISPRARLTGHAFWEMLTFLLNSTLFLLVGLSFPHVVHRLRAHPGVELFWQAAAIAATVIALRLAWMLLLPRLAALIAPGKSWRPGRRELLVLGWSGMRGGVSLAAALSIPVMAGGHPFPGRDQIIFLTYMVLLATLLVPGVTLSPLVRRLGLAGGGRTAADAEARLHILRAALEHLDELVHADELPDELAERLRELYRKQFDRLVEGAADAPPGSEDGNGHIEAELRARRGALAAQRAALAELESTDRIGASAAESVARELDAEDERWPDQTPKG